MEQTHHEIRCPHCAAELPWPLFNAGPTNCIQCLDLLEIAVFPALYKPPEAATVSETVLPEDGSACCFYHPDKKAVVVCEHCGRFLCPLCDIEFGTDHICSTCIEAGTKKKRLDNLQQDITLYGDLAMALGLLGILFWPFGVIIGPIALYLAIRHWRSPGSLIRRTRFRFVLALLLGLIATACSSIFYLFVFFH